jgi:hypothetical protein
MNREMIDTGIEWIGKIPSTWNTSRIGAEYKVRNEKVSDKDYMPLSVTKLTEGIIPQMDQVAKSDAHDDRKLVLKGDFVINSRSDRKMSCGVSNYDGSVSLINTVLQPVGEITSNFTHYLLKNYSFAEEFYKWGHGIVADLWTTNASDLKRITIPVPSVEEQQKIVETLYKKISQIDMLILNQEKQIEKIKEYKQSLITEVVTKGLDPNVEMKDSGVDWLGYIPNHWKSEKLKYSYDNRNEKYIYGEYAYIALENIEPYSGKYIYTETNENYSLNGAIRANAEDVIFGKLRPYLAKTFLIEKDSFVSSEFAVFYSKCNSTAYLKYIFLSNIFIDVINSSTYGTKMPRANIDLIKNLFFAIPPLKEQEAITNYLDKKCSSFDRLIEIKKLKIEKLQDYKKSIIYEYVTGKKEVC